MISFITFKYLTEKKHRDFKKTHFYTFKMVKLRYLGRTILNEKHYKIVD